MSTASPTPVERARAIVLERLPVLGFEEVPLGSALGRTLAAEVVSADDLPGDAVSAMDGFAVRAADTSQPGTALTLVGESRAGHPSPRELGRGEAMRISTGAVLPTGADAVVRVEDADDRNEAVQITVTVEPGHDVRPRGDAIARGELVLTAGADIGAAELGVLAATGHEHVPCVIAPRLTLLTTGDELRPAGTALGPGQIWNSNAHAVAAQARLAGAQVTADHVGDDPDATRVALARALDGSDVVVVCGGVSVGEHDHVRPALARLGVEEAFWRVALRPGKPTWFGRCTGGETLVFGLPGNPVSAMVTFTLFARPAIDAMLGRPPTARTASAVFDADYAKRPGLLHALRCRLDARDDGWHAVPTGPQGSHVLTSMASADALALIESERGDVAAGERVTIELL